MSDAEEPPTPHACETDGLAIFTGCQVCENKRRKAVEEG